VTDQVKITSTTTVPITVENLPKGLFWEADGACWKASRENPATTGCLWRWRPMNFTALAKDGPEGEMTDIPPEVRFQQ
jgi:hypothetical protein